MLRYTLCMVLAIFPSLSDRRQTGNYAVVGEKSRYRSLMDGRFIFWKDVFHGMDVKSDR